MPFRETIPRRVLTIFFILETSDRMNQNGEIDLMNAQMREIIADLEDTDKDNSDAETKVAVLEFNTTTRWITKSPVDFSEFHWQDLKAGGGVDYEKVLVALNEKLSRREFMYSETGQYKPIIIFITKDGPMEGDYQEALRKIRKENRWFDNATKLAFVIGENEAEGLIDFVGNSENLLGGRGVSYVNFLKPLFKSMFVQVGDRGLFINEEPEVPTPIDERWSEEDIW